MRAKPYNLHFTQVCAPTADSEDEETKKFCKDLEDEIRRMPKKAILVVIGDLNEK